MKKPIGAESTEGRVRLSGPATSAIERMKARTGRTWPDIASEAVVVYERLGSVMDAIERRIARMEVAADRQEKISEFWRRQAYARQANLNRLGSFVGDVVNSMKEVGQLDADFALLDLHQDGDEFDDVTDVETEDTYSNAMRVISEAADRGFDLLDPQPGGLSIERLSEFAESVEDED